MKKYKVFEMLKRSQNLKYRLAINSLIVGILVGLTIVAHRIIISKLSPIFLNIYKNGRHNFIIVPFIFLTLIALGYIVGKCLKKQPMISGSGIPQVEGILTRNLKMNWFSVLFYKFVGGLICLCAGLSVGREGPSVQMGACIGEGVSKNLKNLDNEEKYLITSGASAGLSAAFNAPLSGVMFALEEAHKNFSPLVLTSAMIASISADFVSKQFFGLIPSLDFRKVESLPLKNYWTLIILGIIIGISGVIFNKGILKTQSLFKKSKLSIEIKCIIPFVITGVVALIYPILLGGGHDLIMALKEQNFTVTVLFTFIIAKFLFTFICFGSGVPGGIFFPLLVLGALVGNLIGALFTTYFGIDNTYIINFIILAMAGHFASIVKAPITAIILISEMTGSLNHLLALGIVVIISHLTSDILKSSPIYESLLERILERYSIKDNLTEGKKLLLEIVVSMDSVMVGKCIKDIKWPKNCLVVSILRGDNELIPNGDTEIICGDYLTIMTDEEIYQELLDSI